MGMINALGIVQTDTIRDVTRAHHHILWSRKQNYQKKTSGPCSANVGFSSISPGFWAGCGPYCEAKYSRRPMHEWRSAFLERL